MQFHTNFKKSFRQKCDKSDFKNFKELMQYAKRIFAGRLH